MKALNGILFILLVVFPLPGLAAIASTTVWELRTTATAADVNGGGFNPSNASVGTDYSQQTSSQFNGTDLASTVGTTNPCVVTSATHNFVSTDNGNLIHINSGTNWTAGWYEIVSTSGNAATLDRACATSASVSSGTWRVGGALSLQNALDSTWSGVITAGNTIWILAGTFTLTGGFSVTDCTNALPCQWLGYSVSRGDNPTGSSRPTINAVGGQLDLGAFNTIKNIIFTGTNAAVISSDGSNVFYNDKFLNTSSSTGRIALNPAGNDAVISSEVVSQAGFGISGSGTMYLYDNYVHDSATCIRESGTAAANIVGNIIAGCMTNGISFSAATTNVSMIVNNTIYGGNTPISASIGLLLASGASTIKVINNIFYGLVTGVSAAASTNNWGANNDFFNNTTNRTNWATAINDIAVDPTFKSTGFVTGAAGSVSSSTLTDNAADFTNVTDSQDYLDIISGTGVTATPGSILITSHTLHSVTVAAAIGGSGTNILYYVRTGHNFAPGAAVVNKGIPGSFPGALSTGYLSIGAVQKMPGYPRSGK